MQEPVVQGERAASLLPPPCPAEIGGLNALESTGHVHIATKEGQISQRPIAEDPAALPVPSWALLLRPL